MDDSTADSVSVVDNDSGDVIGLLALTRRKQTPAEEPAECADTPQPEVPGFFNAEVLGAVMAAVDELAGETKIVDHYGRAFPGPTSKQAIQQADIVP